MLVLRVLVAGVEHGPVDRADVARREDAHGLLVIVQCQADLLEIIGAAAAPGRLAGGLHGRKQECDQDGDDRDDDQQLDQCEAARLLVLE